MRKFVLAAAVVFASGVGLGLAFAGDGGGPLGLGDKPGVDRTFETVAFKPDPAQARAGASAEGAGKRRRPRILYFLTDELPVPANGTQSTQGVCPSRFKAIDGGYATDGMIFADFLAPVTPDTYAFSVRDFSGLPGSVVFTMTCSKGNG